MIFRRWSVLALAICLPVGVVVVAAAYVFTSERLSDAREARRDDDCGLAESCLAACWRLPGLRDAIDLEDQLSAVQQGDLRDEKAWQSRAVGRSARSRLILEALAKGSLATFQWRVAQTYAESILDQQPTDSRALWLRGRALAAMQQEGEARDDIERALRIEPARYEIRRSLAELLHTQGWVREAIDHYKQLLAERAGDERATIALAHCCQEEARLDEARELVDAMLAWQPDSVAGLVARGRLALRMNDPIAAERWLHRAVDLSPDHSDANSVFLLALQAQHKDSSDLLRHVEQNDRRQAELRTRLRESKADPALLSEVGRWMMRTGRTDEVSGWLFSALKEDATHAEAHLGLAELFSEKGQPRRANRHAKLAGRGPVAQPQRGAATPARKQDSAARRGGGQSTQTAQVTEATSEEVHRLCAACHAYPSPETMPRSAWREEIKQGYDFLRASSLAGDFPPLESVVLYFERRSPERLALIEQPAAGGPLPVTFEKRGTGWVPRLPPQPGISNANLVEMFGTGKQELLLCDTRLDSILMLKPYEPAPGGAVLAQLPAACHTTVCDLDRDGRRDLLVASLGNFFPTDDRIGKVLWLRAEEGGRFNAKVILDGVGRVSDVQVADFNGDGRLDLVVAAFGWRTTGEIVFLENRTTDWSEPQFRSHVVDARHGAIHVPVVDLNGDERPDFVALISQQHETVVAYLNQGDDVFRSETIFEASHPTYGCSGIEVVDLDGDCDRDVLLTNGDILDRPYLLKPYHGVQWLENQGMFPFRHHSLAPMYGASQAVAGDFDGDGDQDIAAVSFLPSPQFPEREKMRLPSVALFEQRAKAQFAMHVLETGTCDHFSCAAGDWDGDGRVDLAVANFAWDGSQPISDAAVLWRNAGNRENRR